MPLSILCLATFYGCVWIYWWQKLEKFTDLPKVNDDLNHISLYQLLLVMDWNRTDNVRGDIHWLLKLSRWSTVWFINSLYIISPSLTSSAIVWWLLPVHLLNIFQIYNLTCKMPSWLLNLPKMICNKYLVSIMHSFKPWLFFQDIGSLRKRDKWPILKSLGVEGGGKQKW